MRLHTVPLLSLLLAPLSAQVPDGWYVWGSFQGTAGQNGIYFSHPRDPLEPLVAVTGLSPALAYDPTGRRGASCIVRRPSDGALLVGERAPAGTSVDLHVLTLQGANVVHAQLFSVGTSAGAGEIPQCALLADGRIVTAGTDLQAGGPLARFLTAQYNWQGVGILDPVSGSVTPIAITNLNQLPGVINALTVTPDGGTIYIGNYISAVAGDVWSVPIAGGTATQVATLGAGASNLAIDNDGKVLITTLNGPPNLYCYVPQTTSTTTVTTNIGPMNAIAVERVTGNYAVASANSGIPARSLFWLLPTGQETLLASPNMATISAIDINHNPESYGAGTVAGTATYRWRLAPSPGGLPEIGNTGFGLTVEVSDGTQSIAMLILGFRRPSQPVTIAGIELHVDLLGAVAAPIVNCQNSALFALPIPSQMSLRGLALFGQSLHLELPSGAPAASPGVELTVM